MRLAKGDFLIGVAFYAFRLELFSPEVAEVAPEVFAGVTLKARAKVRSKD